MGVSCSILPSLQFWSMSDTHGCRQACMVKCRDGKSGQDRSLLDPVWTKHCIMYILSFLYSTWAKPASQAHNVDKLTMCRVQSMVQILLSSLGFLIPRH